MGCQSPIESPNRRPAMQSAPLSQSTSAMAARHQSDTLLDSKRLDSGRLEQARILPITPTPQLGDCQSEPKPDSRMLRNCLMRSLSTIEIQRYFTRGGDICPRDSQNNNPAHVLALYHGHIEHHDTEALAQLKTAASTMMAFYTPIEAALVCMERNKTGATPWDLLTRQADDQLPAGARVIAATFLKAAASPLHAGIVQHQQQCSVINLLPHIKQDEQLLGLIINTDPELVIRYHPQTPQTLIRRLPTLAIAAVELRQPEALKLLLRGGAQCPTQHHPAAAALKQIDQWYGDENLQKCVHTLCDWGITLAPNQRGPLLLPSSLLQVLSHWQYLLSVNPDEHREGVLKVFKLLLDLIERHDTPISLGPLFPECPEGLGHWLQQHVPLLWQQCQANLSTATKQ